MKLAHVDSLLLPLKAMAMEEQAQQATESRSRKTDMGHHGVRDGAGTSIMSLMTESARRPLEKVALPRKRQATGYASRFVLNEARCNDDEEDSIDEEEDTDLSGFIVDDDADISYHDTSAAETEDEDSRRPPAQNPARRETRRRLHRGSPTRRKLNFSDKDSDSEVDKENASANGLSDALQHMHLKEGPVDMKTGEVEVIDLTSSPAHVPAESDLNVRPGLNSLHIPRAGPVKQLAPTANPFDDFDDILKLSPPPSKPELTIPPVTMPPPDVVESDDAIIKDSSTQPTEPDVKTPPATPTRSPSKLESPSKLLSPSKRQLIPQSPHRQSMDAFWDHNVINEWNDEYSPKKAPATSPRKRGLARFQIWSDSEEEEDGYTGGSDSLPDPCSSPGKTRSKSPSPIKSPEKEAKRRLAEEKRAAAARKKAFDACKHQLAVDLLRELDTKVADSELERLASSTGGVRIVWSKTLRSTAGRANWKRTVTKSSGSPVKGGEIKSPGVKVQHFATIELAEKIVDCEDRLVNTLAHEFCHLTNFMVSNIRDQPHGASFKMWATKVTSHLCRSDVEIWRRVQVTTKHSYAINHKYLWVCAGRDRSAAMDFLNLAPDDGCGAEYGRHSKSIDPDKHRCGKCKGRLLQVRPKPRASPTKKSGATAVKREDIVESQHSTSSLGTNSSTGGGSGSGSFLGSMMETIELSD
jgi:predicted SprT family Zn-dependent metalloprotease